MSYPDPYGPQYGGGYGQPGPPPGYPPVPPGYPPVPAGYGGVAPDESNATTAMVLGVLSLLCCGPLGIAAVLVGRRSRRAIEASGNTLGGSGKAQAGEILGWVALGLFAVGLLISAIMTLFFGMSLVALLSGLESASTTTGSY